MTTLRLYLLLLAFCYGCKIVLPPSKRYRITVDGIEARTGCRLTSVATSKFRRDDLGPTDIRPKSDSEICRFNFVLEVGKVGSTMILFDKENDGYRSFPKVSAASHLKIERGFVYQVFGLCDVEGSYYFCKDSVGDKLIIQYQDAGPW